MPQSSPSVASVVVAVKFDPIQLMDGGLALSLYRHMDAELSAPAVFVVDPMEDYRIHHASAACGLLGTCGDSLLGMLLPECVPSLTPSKLDRLWSEIGKSGTASVESEFRSGAGRHIAIEVVFSLLEHGGRYLMAGHVRDITARKQQETPIRDRLEQEQRFSRMAEHLPGFVYTFRKAPDGRASFPYTSSGIQDIYGLQPEDVAEDVAAMVAVTHPDDLPMVLAGIEQSITTCTPYTMEFRVCHPRKGVRWVESKARPDLEPDGSILFHGMMLDITQRKRTESVLSFIAQRGWKDGEEPFLTALARHLGDVLGVDYVIVDKIGDDPTIAETVALYAQGAVLPNMQYNLKGTPCENVMEGSLCCYPSGVQAAFPKDALLGDMQAESYAGHALWDSTGKVIGLIAVLDGKPMRDVALVESMLRMVSTRVAAELERDLSERALAASRQFLQQVIDTVAVPVFVKDRQHRWIWLNQAFCRLMGQPLEALLGKSDFDFFAAEKAGVFWDKDELVFTQGGKNVNEELYTDAAGVVHTIITSKTCFTDAHGATILVGSVNDITPLKQTQRRLEEAGNRLRSLADNMPDNIARWDTAGRILFSNPTHQRTLGKPAAELIGKTHNEAFPDDRYRPVDTAIAQVVASGEPVVFVRQLAPAENGEMRIHDIKLVPEFDDAGQVASVLGIGRDMTDVYRMQEAVAAREQEFRSLAENLPDNIGRWDIAGRYIYINPTYERTLGTQAAGVIGKTIAEAFPARRESPAAMAVARVIATGEAVPCVRQLVPAENGEMRIHEVNMVPERDVDGSIVGVLGIGRDMTDIYRMQEAVAAREQEFRSLAENSPNSIIRYDRAGRIRYLNAGLGRTLGVTEADLIGKLPSEVWPDGRFDDIQRAAAQAVATETEVSIEICDPVAEGEGQFHQIRIVPEQDVAGQVIGTIAFGWDITGLKRYAQSLQERVKLEGQLSGLAASVPGFIFTVRLAADRHISFPFASAGIEDLVGFRPEDIRDDVAVLHTRYHPDDLPRVYAGMEASERTLSPFRIEIRVFHPEHGMRWVEIRSMPQRYEDGSTEWHGIMLDITERKAVEKQLTLLHSSLDHVNDTVLLVSEDAGILYVNQGACHVLGYPREQLLGMRVADIDPDYQLDIWPEHWRDLKIHGALNFESRHMTADGRVYPVDITANYVEFEGQGYNLGICRDITERKQAEMLVAEREREFRTLAENAPELIIRYDKECRRIYANPAYAKDMGVQRADIANKTPLQFWRPSNVSAENYMAQLRRVMETGESSEVFLEWVSADGRLQYRCLSLVAEYDSDGEPCGALAIGHDISASRKSEMLAKVRMSIFEQLTKGGDIREVLHCVADFVEVSSPGLLCSIMLVDAEGKHLRTAAAPSLPAFYSEAVDGIAIGEGIGCCGTAVWRGEAVLAEDIARHPYWTDLCALAAQAGLAACWSFPLKGADGMLGTFAVYRRVTGLPTEEDMALIREASHLAVISIERKQREEKLMRQASYDTLTGLPNRRLFSNRLKEEVTRAERAGHNVGLLFIDLDRFKEVNDNLGHDFGDSLLIEASHRIRHCVRESDSVARLGGDEFVVILPEIEEITHLGRVAQDLLDVMAQAFVLGGHSAYVSASIGIACYPADADNMDSLMGCADQAMYAAKQLGRNGFSFFTAAMQQQAQQRMHLANDLRDAVAYGQLQVYYQPIVDIGSRRVVKAEALLRWRHPVRGMVPPDHFIPIAEEIGIIHEIGEWVFREAANTAKRWREIQGAADSCPLTAACPPQVSVNMSPRQFMRGNVGSSWMEYLHAVGLPAEAMVIEITEGLLLGDQSDILEKLERFRAAGMRIALDDFGTGYSAMAYLKKFPIDYLKIDRSFVRDLETDPNDRAIAEAIVVMARKLGLKTIAEGVETESQRDLLAEVGCDYVQGYLYAKPMPVENFLAYMAAING